MSIELKASLRQVQGTSASRRLRREGGLPAVVYGGDKPAQAIVLEHKAVFYALRDEAFHAQLLSLDLDGEKETVLLRDYQMHPYKQQVLHVDLQRVCSGQKLRKKVGLHFVNVDTSPAVKLQGGKVNLVVHDLELRALPEKILPFIEVDLGDLHAGQTVLLSDISVPDGVEFLALTRGDDLTLVSVSGAKAIRE